MKSVWSLVLLVAVAAATPLAAQGREDRPPRGAMAARQMDGRLTRFLETHRAELGLTAEQSARIEQIETRLREQNRPLLEQVRENRREAMQQLREVLTEEQRERARDLMRERRDDRRGERPGMGRRGERRR